MVLFSTLQRIKNRTSSRGSVGSTSELITSPKFLHYQQQVIKYSTAELFLMGNFQNYSATYYPPFSHYLFLTETLQTDLFKGVQGEMNSHHMPGFPLHKRFQKLVHVCLHSASLFSTAQDCSHLKICWRYAMIYFKRLGLLSLRYSLVPQFFTPESNSHASPSLTLPWHLLLFPQKFPSVLSISSS